MIYLIVGENSYQAQRKIAEIKDFFIKKGGSKLMIEMLDGLQDSSENIYSAASQPALFSGKKLVIFKNSLKLNFDFFKKSADSLSSSTDVYIFWEEEFASQEKEITYLKKFAKQIQKTVDLSAKKREVFFDVLEKRESLKLSKLEKEAILDKAAISGEWTLENEVVKRALGYKTPLPTESKNNRNSLFYFADGIFSSDYPELFLKQAYYEGVNVNQLLYTILWKLKNIYLVMNGESSKLNRFVAGKAVRESRRFKNQRFLLRLFWASIKTESSLRKREKNAEEAIEIIAFSLAKN